MKFALIPLVLVFVLSACTNNPRDRVVGVWTSDPKQLVIPEIPPIALGTMVPANAQKMLQKGLSNVLVKMRSDGTFVVTAGFSADGRWKLEGQNVVFTLKKKVDGPFNLNSLIQSMEGDLDSSLGKMNVKFETLAGPVKMVLKKTA